MILAAYDDERGEDALSRLLGTGEFGTPVRNITRTEYLGYQVALVRSALMRYMRISQQADM